MVRVTLGKDRYDPRPRDGRRASLVRGAPRTNVHALEAIVTNLADNLTTTAEEHADRPAVKLDDVVLTYRELQDGARRVAAC